MALGWLKGIIAFVAMMGAGGGKQATQETRIRIQYSTPDRIVAILTPGEKSEGFVAPPLPKMRAEARTNSVVVTGTQEEIKDLQQIIRMVDILPKRLRVGAWLYRVREQNGHEVSELLAQTTSITANNAPVSVGVGDESWDQTVTVTPRINGEGSVSLRLDFAFGFGGTVKQRLEPITRRVGSGKIVSVTYSDMPEGVAYVKADDGVAKATRLAGGRPKYRIEAGAEIMPDIKQGK